MTVFARALAFSALTIIAPTTMARAQSAAPSAGVATTAPAVRGEIRGRVVNAAGGMPLGSANVDVTLAEATVSAARASADAEGDFRIRGLRPGRYRVNIRALGYAPQSIPAVVIGERTPSVDVGAVALTAVAVEMQRVVVMEQERDVQLAPDRNTYVVRDMPTTRGGNALDVLRNVPSVDVNIDNQVSLRGNSGVMVQINGRPSPMKAAQLGNFLAQLPADMVDKVEVVSNPSAGDDPEGVAGIINIVMKRDADPGLSGGLTLGGGTTGRADAGGNVGYQRGSLSLHGSYGFQRDHRPRRDSLYRENLYLQPTTFLLQEGRRTQRPLGHTVTGTAGYRFGGHHELTSDVMYSTRSERETSTILYRDLDASRALAALNDRTSSGKDHEYNFESTLGYKRTFAGQRHELTSELRAFRGREGGANELVARTLELDGAPQHISARESESGFEHPKESSFKLDYVRPLASRLRMSAGYRGTVESFRTTQDTRVFDSTSIAFVQDTTRTNDFTYDQLVNAAYGMLNGQAGKFVLQGGVRLERATTQFHLNAKNATFDNDYNSVFPSALVAYNIDDARQVKVSFSTRIRRPDDADQLDPTLRYQDPLNVSRGNPNLRPEYIRSVELGLQRTAEQVTVQVTPFYRHTIDAVRQLRSIDSAGVATRTFANIATTDAYGTDATVALHGGRVGGFVGASLFRQVSNASNLDSALSARTFGWTARTNASFRFSKSRDLQTLLFYHAPMTVEQGRNSARTRFSLAARQKLMADQVSLTLRVIDPFANARERFTTTDARFYQVSDRRRADRGLLLSVNWRFGTLSKERGRDADDDEGGDAGPS